MVEKLSEPMTFGEFTKQCNEWLQTETYGLKVYFLHPRTGEPLPVTVVAGVDRDDKCFYLGGE